MLGLDGLKDLQVLVEPGPNLKFVMGPETMTELIRASCGVFF